MLLQHSKDKNLKLPNPPTDKDIDRERIIKLFDDKTLKVSAENRGTERDPRVKDTRTIIDQHSRELIVRDPNLSIEKKRERLMSYFRENNIAPTDIRHKKSIEELGLVAAGSMKLFSKEEFETRSKAIKQSQDLLKASIEEHTKADTKEKKEAADKKLLDAQLKFYPVSPAALPGHKKP